MSNKNPIEFYQPLFDYFMEEHGFPLLESEMGDIISIVEGMVDSPLHQEMEKWMREVAEEGFGNADIIAILNAVKKQFVTYKKKKNHVK